MRAIVIGLAVLAAPALAQGQQRGYMGIHPAELTPESRKAHKVADGIERGLVLIKVYEDSAAAKAGLRAGDVLTAFNNKPVNSIEGLIELISDTRPGQRVAYVARRGSGTIAGLLVLGTPPDERAEAREVESKEVRIKERKQGEGDELDVRMERLKRDIEVMRAEAEKRKADAERAAAKERDVARAVSRRRGPAPKNIVGWMELEERRIDAAKKSRNERAVLWHSARMQMLRELREAGYNVPSNAKDGNRNRQQTEQRVRKLEKQLRMVLERLEQLESKR